MSIQVETFTQALYGLLDEAFDNVHGYFLDPGTSLFETLATVSATEASIPVGGRCATLAAQVKHVAFFLEVVERMVRTGQFEQYDWGKIWREVKAVSPEEWATIQAELRVRYDGIKALIAETTAWDDVRTLGGAMGTVVHTAYHLGEIRQALCVLKG